MRRIEQAPRDRQGVIVATDAEWRARVAALGLRLKDAGVGVKYSSVANGAVPGEAPLGVVIPGMRARIEQLGGRLLIDSSRGGAVVTVEIPLDG
jgi:signal transduction histidine kinase